MDIFSAFFFISDMFVQLLRILNAFHFKINDYDVSFGGMVFVFIVVLFVINLFWKGAKA